MAITRAGDVPAEPLAPDVKELQRRLDALEGTLTQASISPLTKSQTPNIRVTKLSAISADLGDITAGSIIGGTFQTGTTVPYATLDSDGLLIVNDFAGSSGIRFKNDSTDTIAELRETEGGLAIASDETDIVTFRLYDTEYSAGITGRRLNVEMGASTGIFEMADTADDVTFQVLCDYSAGITYLKTFGDDINIQEVVIDSSGNLHIKSGKELRFYDNGNYVGFEAPALSADQIWILPDADGNANDLLRTDGAGNLEWADLPTHMHVYQEDLSAQCNGAKQTFLTNNQLEQYTLNVYHEGLLLREGAGKDYTEGTFLDAFTLLIAAPIATDTLVAEYLAWY